LHAPAVAVDQRVRDALPTRSQSHVNGLKTVANTDHVTPRNDRFDLRSHTRKI
jgi:hypothetical protein